LSSSQANFYNNGVKDDGRFQKEVKTRITVAKEACIKKFLWEN